MFKLLSTFIIFIAVTAYAQYDPSDYQVIGYHPVDTSIYLEANSLHVSNHKPWGVIGIFRVSEQFMRKYSPGKIFNYITWGRGENRIWFIRYEFEDIKVEDKR
jgi:hypothetical protein